jgi:hypothetical protein
MPAGKPRPTWFVTVIRPMVPGAAIHSAAPRRCYWPRRF